MKYLKPYKLFESASFNADEPSAFQRIFKKCVMQGEAELAEMFMSKGADVEAGDIPQLCTHSVEMFEMFMNNGGNIKEIDMDDRETIKTFKNKDAQRYIIRSGDINELKALGILDYSLKDEFESEFAMMEFGF